MSKHSHMALDVAKIVQHNLPDTCYFNETSPKTLIVVHHTAGNSNPIITIDGWKTRTDKVATAFVIGGKPKTGNAYKDGDIYQAFSSKASAYHLGLKAAHFAPFGLPYKDFTHNSIGIEICNWGPLTKESNGTYKTYVGSVVSSDEVVELDKPYKGFKFYHKYTDAQLKSLSDLLIYLCDKYNISKDYNGDAIFEPNKDALSGKSGIFTHTSFRPDKSDCSPQLNLINVLKNLKNNTIQITPAIS